MPDIVITITMPENGQATLLMRRGDLAVTHTYLGNIPGSHNDRRALERAYDKLTALESNPPDIPDPPKQKSKVKRKPKADAEPTVEIPPAKDTRTVPLSRVKLTGGETDAAACQQALACAGRLIDSGLWDGESQIYFDDVYATAKKIKGVSEKEIGSLFTLEAFVRTHEMSQKQIE